MRGGKGNPAELYKAASFGLAWSAGVATMLFAFAYFWLLEDAPAGWFNDFAPHPRDIDWSRLLDGAESATIVARWFDTWSNENRNALDRFFERGGQLEAVMLDPGNEEALRTAAAQHQGFAAGGGDVDAARKVSIGLARLAQAAERAPRGGSLIVRLVTNPRMVMSQTLMRFEGPGGTRLVAYPLDNFRDAGHRSPAIVLDPSASHQLKEFWESERRGFEENSRRLSPDEIRGSK